jgi:hypothetical protein
MSFASAAGYGNLPNGYWSPVIYSKKAQLQFRKISVVQAITNTDYYGEINEMGDTVNVIKEPTIVVSSYARGQNLDVQDLIDTQLTMVVDQGNYFAFAVDDIERRQSHINWESMAADQGAYRLRDGFDTNVLSYIKTNIVTAQTVGTTGTPVKVNHDGTYTLGTEMTPVMVLNRMARFLDANNVPHENRWVVVDPFFLELLRDDRSVLVNDYYVTKGVINNGLVTNQPVQGFKLYMSNNLPYVGTGPSATSGTNYGYILGGHISAVATAEQIKNSEKIRSERTFADIVRGLHIFGRKLLRSEALVAAIYNNAT